MMMESVGGSLMMRDLKVKHPQTALLFIIDIVDATYYRISGGDPTDEKAIMEECLDAVYKYHFL